MKKILRVIGREALSLVIDVAKALWSKESFQRLVLMFGVVAGVCASMIFWHWVFSMYGHNIVRWAQDPVYFGLFCWVCGAGSGALLVRRRAK